MTTTAKMTIIWNSPTRSKTDFVFKDELYPIFLAKPPYKRF